mmetsp:Transcript_5670/g.7093  ORF Transcript_5670/g.7093 Transcript_5670/m.7093 type:complete len:116 (-) Transcript_5670:264-611(-)|eukprot:CAMPEP_0172491272 /NCGR_PEP_ID=MMETSP1066-20121228/22008_1 /TAXON_ID=671091 /ORGANISM="Coscinodiscus wailesii, Strain CCMP2513" /LENGTH=115 /DNA_ID=CAMNT_0013260219 /DNA_START=88 /DNA_END=435 /DNA_ORIENTATION=-
MFSSHRLSLVIVMAMAISLSSVLGFAPTTTTTTTKSLMNNKYTTSSSSATPLNMGFGLGDGDEPKKLTRENEPEEYFATNLDKLSDEEKLPIALAGLAGISLPFIAGLIALYASK